MTKLPIRLRLLVIAAAAIAAWAIVLLPVVIWVIL